MLTTLRQDLLFILANANLIDYMAYGWVVLCFILLMLIGFYCTIKWWWQIGFLIILLDVIALFVGGYYANLELSKRLRPTEISPLYLKQLKYSDNLVVDLNITNLSKNTFQICKINIGFYANSDQELKNFVNAINPFRVKSIYIGEPLHPGATKELTTVVENFAFIDYNTTVKTECFE
ncbi:DUF2393 family protein [Campylobacter suis]|uniref:DUF2393 domain-containing protein n=1 Tax=Campylobacter suis TaxID=2790657 RepID=A0ABM8Q4T8_9BACT|nr:DUF2393 family protein [Campylobacter suis]CAD7287881.1 hypothetical protein LMG8286_00982 [Campylobacter suis]